MRINHRTIGPDQPPYIISEIGANHGGSAYQGKLLIDAAKDAGADAVKLQCYTADEICIKGNTKVESETWKDQNLYALYQKAETPRALVKELFEYSRKLGIDCFSSVFSFDGADFVKSLGMPAIKIASFELVDTPLIEYCASLGLPMIISTGMGTSQEVISAINAYNSGSRLFGWESHNLALLHCISSYPAKPEEANLPALGPLSELLGGRHVVGFSDHTLGIGSAVGAVAFGASIIEKHFILDRAGNRSADSSFSMEPSEFAAMVTACKEAWAATRCPTRHHGRLTDPQDQNRAYRKSLWIVKNVSVGEVLSRENCRILRPAHGADPSFYASVLGVAVNRDLKAGTPLRIEMVGPSDLHKSDIPKPERSS